MNTPPNIPVTNTILDFIKELKKYNTAIDAIKNIFNEDNDAIQIYKTANKTLNLKSKQGFIYELLWDICIKLNITELTDIYEPHNNIHHLVGNVNNNTSTFETINDSFFHINVHSIQKLKEHPEFENLGKIWSHEDSELCSDINLMKHLNFRNRKMTF